MASVNALTKQIAPYVPEGTAGPISEKLKQHRCHLVITRDRKTKAGDYRMPIDRKGHRISINGGRNRFAFLITFIHELAHLETFEKHGRSVRPHGPEWKAMFQQLMRPFLTESIFPAPLLSVLSTHMQNPLASSARDQVLMRQLGNYDTATGLVFLEDVRSGSVFIFNDRKFKKGKKLRKRFRCEEVSTGRTYAISAVANVRIDGIP